MGSLFRSEEMQLSQIFLHADVAYMCISELGELGLVQFRDTIPGVNAFQRKFVNEVRRCDEMERKLRFLELEIEKGPDPLIIFDPVETPGAPAPREIADLETVLEKLENELKEVNSSSEQLTRTSLEAVELKQILRKTQAFFDEALHDRAFMEENVGLLGIESGAGASAGMRLGSIAGVINRDRLVAFERMLWRACRGNVFLKQADIEDQLIDPSTGSEIQKSVFMVFFQGDQLRNKVKDICEGFHATIYPCPDSQADRREMTVKVVEKINDLAIVISQTKEHRQRVLETAAKNLRFWLVKVRKIKAIYHTLNLFNLDGTTKLMVGECWCAVNDVNDIQVALMKGMEQSNSAIQPIINRLTTKEEHPTYHRTNKFTQAFQNIIDAYGVARYREVNPALFTVITFPFLFAVMFGDAGHGLLMFLFALWMVVAERKLQAKKSDNEIWNTFFNGRYIILLMGIFSIYTGLVYNDIFSRSINLFGSSWYPNYDQSALDSPDNGGALTLNPSLNATPDRMYAGYPYAFGLDPVWQLANNKIMLTNSIKMKLSIVLGVLHMLAGLSLGFFNHRFFKDRLAIICELIPQLLFLCSIFLYLVVLIFYKWIAYTSDSPNPPSLLIGLISMVRFDYSGEPIYSGQKGVQITLLFIAFISIPWMLLSKPVILLMAHRSIEKASHGRLSPAPSSVHVNLHSSSPSPHHDDDMAPLVESGPVLGKLARFANIDPSQQFDFGELMVHQSIHTIEYCLSCISNTASYLRLWALSLAHAQLSEVLWTMVLHLGLNQKHLYGSIILVFVFAFWAILTVCILLVMEGLSAFLHTLRLHWVEFQNKFYHGDGVPFIPFSFVDTI